MLELEVKSFDYLRMFKIRFHTPKPSNEVLSEGTEKYFNNLIKIIFRRFFLKQHKSIFLSFSGGAAGVMVWHGCSSLLIEWSGFEPWPGKPGCVLGQDTLLSKCLSPPRCINGYGRI